MPIEYIPHPITANINDVTGARAFGVLYTNNTLRPIMVIISMVHITTAINEFNLAQCNVNGVANNFCGWFNSHAAAQMYGNIQVMIPPAGTYIVNTNITAPGAINLISWIEVNL